MQDSLAHIKKLTTPVQDYVGKLKKIAAEHRYVAFYGCGVILNSIIFESWHACTGIKIDFLCDSNPTKWHSTIHGIHCISPDELFQIKDDTAVFITTGAMLEVYDFLKKRDFPSVYPVYKYDLHCSPLICSSHLNEIQEKLAAAYMLLNDKRSIEVFESVLQRAFLGSDRPELMSTVMESDQCFANVITLNEHESFVDGGAFDGDTIEDFLRRVNGKFEQIHAFELCTENYCKLVENMRQRENSSKIHCYALGLWDSKKEIRYNSSTTQSTIGLGSEKGIVDRLDSILGQSPVTFIKLDIEGAEMHALRGAQNIIRTQKPKMAVCVYHDLRHLYEVPLYLHSLVPEYKIYLRHHTVYEYETICYATI